MKILVVSNLFPPNMLGGAEAVAYQTTLGLVSKGHQVSVATFKGPERPKGEEGFEILQMQIRGNLYEPYYCKEKPSWMKPVWHLLDFYNVKMKSNISALIKETKPDIVHCHNIGGFSSAVWAAAGESGVPVVQHIHDFHLACFRGTLSSPKTILCKDPNFLCTLRARFHRHMMEKYVACLIFPSTFCLRTFVDVVKPKSVRMEVVPHGVSFPKADTSRIDWNSPCLHVLYMGNLAANKGFEVFVAVVERMADKEDRFHFHVAGKGALEMMARTCASKRKNVTFHGFVEGENKTSLLESCHLLVFPSLCPEVFGLSVAEACSAGIPVIASDVGSISEILGPFGRDMLVPPGEPDAIISKLMWYYENRDLLTQTSADLRRNRDSFDFDCQIGKLLSLYEQVLSQWKN